MISEFINLGIGFVGLMLLSLLGFAGLRWLQLPGGSVMDWIIGGASFWWLLVIVTVPWNVYFQAKAVLADAALSAEKQIPVDANAIAYAQLLATRSRWVALALHGISAIGLYALSATGISAVGYVSSGAALLLTGLRPAIGAYQYFSTRLSLIQQEFTYPRQDVAELRSRVQQLEATLQQVADQLNPEHSYSLAATQQRSWDDARRELARLAATQEELRATNQTEHERLAREARQAIAQLTTDGQFLDHVREIIRFFKTA